MLTKFIGWFWIVLGAFFLLKPGILKTKLQKKGARKVKKILFAVAIILGISLIAASWKMQGLLSKAIMIAGIVAIIKGVLFLKSKFTEKLLDWLSRQPVIIFRVIAFIYIVIGAVILLNYRKL